MNLTNEQKCIIDAIEEDSCKLLKINSVAGSGKTSMLIEIAETLTPGSGMYLAYNKAIAVDSQGKFPKAIKCMTTHSLAYRNTVKQYGLSVGFFNFRDIKDYLPYEFKLIAIEFMNSFFLSKYTKFEDFKKATQENTSLNVEKTYDMAIKYVKQMFAGQATITHAGYLKFYHILLDSKTIEPPQVDLLMLDESGDLNAVTLEIFKLLPAKKKIMVGDECLTKNTHVLTSTGLRKIKSIISDINENKKIYVSSYNIDKEIYEYKQAINPLISNDRKTIKITMRRGSFECTPNHRVLKSNKTYEYAGKLKIGDILAKDISNQRKAKQILNDRQHQVLLGSFLGDGNLDFQKSKQELRLAINHSSKQQNYLKWKASIFNIDNVNIIKNKERVLRGKILKESISYGFRTRIFCIEEPITINSINKLDPLGLAIWLMDDGSIKSRNKKTQEIQGITLSSNSFSYEDHIMLIKILKNNFDLEAVIGRDRKYYELNFRKNNSKKLLEIVKEYIHDDFINKFKILKSNPPQINNKYSTVGGDIITNIEELPNQTVYDFEVKDNNNFMVTSTGQKADIHSCTIVHNCQNIYTFNETINCFAEMEDEGIQLEMTQSFRCEDNIAQRIEAFGQEYINDYFQFKGIKKSIKEINTINSTAYISRNNSQLVAKIIELNDMDVPFNLTRTAFSIFELVLILMNLNPDKPIHSPEWKHLNEDVNEWNNDIKLQDEYDSEFMYISYIHEEDTAIKTAISLIINHGKANIYNAYNNAKKYEKSKNYPYTVCTAHSSKGEQKYLHIA